MNIVGFVYGLNIVNDKTIWHSSFNSFLDDQESEEPVVNMENICRPLFEFIDGYAVYTGVIGKEETTNFRIISLAEIKLRCISLIVELDESSKEGKVIFAQYKFLEELKELIRKIESIADQTKVEERELYLIFFFE